MGTTAGGLRYPEGSDPANVPSVVQNLAEDVDTFKAPKANPTITGVLTVPAGTATAPSITTSGDTNTGVHFPAADTVAVTTGGTERVRVNATGQVGIGISPSTNLHIAAGTAAFSPNVFIDNNAADDTAGYLYFRKARNSAIVNSGDALGNIPFSLFDGGAYRIAAMIRGAVDAAPGASDAPGRLVFFTTPDGGTSLTERMRVDGNGLITGTGTSLGAWTAYTPTLGGTGWALGAATVVAAYCQIGKTVHVRVRVLFAADSTFGAVNPTLSLPVSALAAQNNGNFRLIASAFDSSLGQFHPLSARFDGGVIAFRTLASPEASVTSTAPMTWTTSDQLAFNGTYEVA